MTDTAFLPFGGGDDPDPPQLPASGQGRIVVAATLAVLAVLSVVGYLLLSGSSADGPATGPVARAARPLTTPVPAPGGAAPPAGKPARPQASPPPLDVVGRNPFHPLSVAAAEPGDVRLSAADTTPGAAPESPAATGNGSPTSSTSLGLSHVYVRNSVQYAHTTIDSVEYDPAVGEIFASRFRLESVAGSCANFLDGTARFRLCSGQRAVR